MECYVPISSSGIRLETINEATLEEVLQSSTKLNLEKKTQNKNLNCIKWLKIIEM